MFCPRPAPAPSGPIGYPTPSVMVGSPNQPVPLPNELPVLGAAAMTQLTVNAQTIAAELTETAQREAQSQEVIIDTSALLRKTWGTMLFPGEVGVVTPTIMIELADVVARPGMFMPNFLPPRLVPDSIDLGVAASITAQQRRQRAPELINFVDAGDAFDGLIGSTAITTRRPIVTADVGFRDAVNSLGGQARLLP